MYKIYIVLFIIILILLLGNMFITREGFFSQTTSVSNIRFDNCVFDEEKKDDDCNKGITANGHEFKIHNVCPLNPKCLGVCVNDFTWTEENIAELSKKYNIDTSSFKLGELKNEDDLKLKAIFQSSRCMECVKNFYQGISLMQSVVDCDYIK
jgi:hypothetical protein